MKAAKIAIVLCLFLVAHVAASGRTSVYAVVEKVVFEPNEANAERIQLWGAFSFVGQETFPRSAPPPETTSDPIRGYMHFSLPPGTPEQLRVVRAEWSDLKALASTGQGVSFGQWMYMGQMAAGGPTGSVYVSVPDGQGNFRGAVLAFHVSGSSGQTRPPVAPTPWVTNTGLVKLSAEGSHAAVVNKLRDALAKGVTR